MAEDQPTTGGPENPADNLRTLSSSEGGAKQTGSRTLPQTIGRYRIIRVLGEGGMGTVFEAEQDQPRRKVALKVIRTSWASPQTLRRFDQESQVLGRLHHPGIAQIYEAGSADSGSGFQPFFAMELIHGTPLTLYAVEHKLDFRQRLKLMILVCDAVQHAHLRGIIHRDLKPGNILVDEMSQPKILDFGLARATDCDAEATRQTDVGQMLGTLAYMSPEQVLADPIALDTRSDVYSLGVILYELLSYKMPYTVSRQVHEAVRVIQECDPAPLSSVNRLYRGDIETIVAKALEKDKSRRYGSAADLAGDIQRYLDDQPITAKPASVSYQLRKFARRHKALATGVAATFMALLLGVVASTREAVRARRAEHKAQQQTEIAQAVTDFLQKDLLAQASANNQSGPTAKPDPDLKVRTALDRAAGRIEGKFANQPEVEASIRDTIGQTYLDLGLYPEAREQLERALDLHRRVLGTGNPKTIKTISRLGRIADLQGRYPEAETLFRQALDSQRRLLGPEHPDTLISLNGLAGVYYSLGKYPEAEALDSQTLEIRRRVLGSEHPDTLASNNGLAIDYQMQGKYAQAEALDSQTLEIRRRVLGPEHPDTLNSMNNLAIVYYLEGKYAQAVALYSQTLEIRRRVLGPDHPYTLSSMHNLATAYYYQGNYAQAEELHRQTLEIKRRVLGPEHPDTLTSMNNLAAVCAVEGKYAEAEALFTKAVEISRRVLGPEHPLTLSFLAEFAFLCQREGKYTSAETYAAQALAGRRHTLGPKNADTMSSAEDLALAYQSEGKFVEAEPLAREALEFNREQQPDDWQRFRAESLLGASLAGQKKYAEAEPLLLEGYRGMLARRERMGATDRYHLDRAREWILQLYKAWGKPQKAAQMAQELER